MYEQSLGYFSEAYCIQSRLALQLSQMGLHEAAEAHYRKAYELMPESFGRVESHCFGCEGAFEGERAQGIADKVFTSLAQKTPNKPQVHYLLGYLRATKGRQKAAAESYRKAVELDPNYLNAWAKLSEVAEAVQFDHAQQDEIIFNLMRLDPLHRHVQAKVSEVVDLAKLWTLSEEARTLLPVQSKTLFALPASAERLAKIKTPATGSDFTDFAERMSPFGEDMEVDESLGNPLAGHQVVGVAIMAIFSAENN